MKVVIFNQKGGVGKTTTAVNLGAALARSGAGRVVLADLDPQMHLTASLGFDPEAAGWTAADWLAGRPGAPVEVPDEPGLSLVPGAADPLSAEGGLPEVAGDWLIMDCAPVWSPLVLGFIKACDLVICPLEPDFLGLSGVNRLLRQLRQEGLPLDRIRLLVSRYNRRLVVHREVRARLLERFGDGMLLPVEINSSVRLAETPGYGRTIFTHAPDSTGATDFTTLASLLTGRGKKKTRRQDA